MAKPAFKARKTRERKPKPTRKVAKAMVPSAALEEEYMRIVKRLVLESVLSANAIRSGYAEDRITLSSLKTLRAKAFEAAANFVGKVNKHSVHSVWKVIEQLGKEITVGRAEVTPMIREQIEYNVGLITDLATETQDKLTKLYQKEGIDQAKIYEELKEHVGNRAKLIAKDQNAKIFTSLNTERMLEAELDTFFWDHSAAGKTPRQCHIDRDGHEFSLKGSPSELFWPDGKDANQSFNARKSDYGKPGWAINCRCRMRPSISLDD